MMERLLRHGGGSRLVPVTIRYIEERRVHSERWTSGLVDFAGPLAAIWGEQDPVAVPAMVGRLAGLRDDVEVVRWPDVGHWPQLEVPDRLAAEIDRLTSDR
ncbi:MAG: alpha/beta hydrolase [Actinomycetota bacterium]|nr:alpha/beta hydrolase [Actinomycetota bacterium]